MYSIEEKVALVTGSTAGLGKNLASELSAAGAKVILNGRDEKKLDQAATELLVQGFETITIPGDVTSPEDCRRIIDGCISHFGRLDILISNAGVGCGGRFDETTTDTFRKVFEVNTLGTIYITRMALPHIIRTGGSIVFISSLAAMAGLPYTSLYSSTKMALTAIGQSLQEEVRSDGVHVGIAYVGFLKNGPEKRVLGPSGDLQPTGERQSFRLMDMALASRIIIRLIKKRKRKVIMSPMGKWSHAAIRFTPWLIRLIIRKSMNRARRAYEPGT